MKRINRSLVFFFVKNVFVSECNRLNLFPETWYNSCCALFTLTIMNQDDMHQCEWNIEKFVQKKSRNNLQTVLILLSLTQILLFLLLMKSIKVWWEWYVTKCTCCNTSKQYQTENCSLIYFMMRDNIIKWMFCAVDSKPC